MSETLQQLLGLIFATILIVVLLALPLMLLWNWLMPEIFGLKEITFLQALGLNLMSKILFKSYSSK